jgi:hypothetical protein
MLRASQCDAQGDSDLNRALVDSGSDTVGDQGAAVVRVVGSKQVNRDFLPASLAPMPVTAAAHKDCPYRRWPTTT